MNSGLTKTLGLYILIALAILRFAVVPLHKALKDKATLLNDYKETYKVAALAHERRKSDLSAPQKDLAERQDRLKSLYQKGEPYSTIQADLIQKIIEGAQKKGMTVVSYQLMEVAQSKVLSEVPVSVKLDGTALMLMDLLVDMKAWDKKIKIRHLEASKGGKGSKDMTFSITLSVFRVER